MTPHQEDLLIFFGLGACVGMILAVWIISWAQKKKIKQLPSYHVISAEAWDAAWGSIKDMDGLRKVDLLKAGIMLSRIYFEIAAALSSEDEVRKIRDQIVHGKKI